MKPLMVLAMHRSGTSLVSSWLEACGLQMSASRRMGAGIGNELGHFEDLDFVELHERSIRRQVPKSWGWKVYSPKRLKFNDDEVNKAKELILARQAMGMPWGWKDPRSILFASEWKSLIPDLQAVVLWRRGTRIIDSLVRRSIKQKADWPNSKIGYVKACQLHRAHNKLLIKYIEQHQKDVIGCSIEDLARTDGSKLLETIENRCGISLRGVSFQRVFNPSHMNRKVSLQATLSFIFWGGLLIDSRRRRLLPSVLL